MSRVEETPLRLPAATPAAQGPSAGSLESRRASWIQRVPWSFVCLGWDIVALTIAAIGAQFAVTKIPPAPVQWIAVYAGMVLLLAYMRGSYRETLRPQLLEVLRGLLAATAVAAVFVIAVRVIDTDDFWTASQSLRQWAFSLAVLAAGRAALAVLQAHWRRTGEAARRTLIVGAGQVGVHAARRLLERPEFGLRPVGFLDKDPLPDAEFTGVPVLGASWDLERVVRQHDIGFVVITFSTAPHTVLLRLVERCEQLGVPVALVPRLFEKVTGRIAIEHLGGLPLLSIRRADPGGWQFAIKYGADRLVALVALAVTAPALLLATLAVWASLGRPILYRQTRVGLDGRTFDMLKFRTMRPPRTDGATVLAFAGPDIAPGGVEGEDRRTTAGTLLRQTSVDELPQLINVLRGEMSLIGPRPERPEFAQLFAGRVHRYTERHRVKSGITGWAQVHGLRGKTSLADRVEWDNYYIENWSLWLDVKIALLTIAAVLRPRGVE
jgi:exopolysaccharide biosynthesis polyprenyl glycosylphosphotransferase